ncbi:MAG TPA: hypothetical protein VIY08_01850 [Candidatus Nitrosocosmicus sp.]
MYTRRKGRYVPILVAADGIPTERKYPGGLYTQKKNGQLTNVHKTPNENYFNDQRLPQNEGEDMLQDFWRTPDPSPPQNPQQGFFTNARSQRCGPSPSQGDGSSRLLFQ